MCGGRLLTRQCTDERGVSPVVGMVLILAISVVATGVTLMWGLPAIDEMKASVEVESVKGQFQELNADIQELVAGTAGQTAKPWQPSLQRGELHADNSSERWLIAIEKRSHQDRHTYAFDWGCMTGDGNTLCVRNAGTDLANVHVNVYHVTGTSKVQGLVSGDDAATAPSSRTALGTVALPATGVQEFHIYSADATRSWRLEHVSVMIEIVHEGAGPDGEDFVAAEAWIFNAGQVRYMLRTDASLREVVSTNGALLSGGNDAFAVLNAPGIPAPKMSSDGTSSRFFLRLVELDGNAGFSGTMRFNALLSLYGTTRLQEHDCSTDAHQSAGKCLERVRVYPLGRYAPVWRDHITEESRGYRYMTEQSHTDPADAGVEHEYVLYEPPQGRHGFWGVHSVIKFRG